MSKSLRKIFNAIRSIKIPWRFKSKYHDNFHCTGDQIYLRQISELSSKGASKNEIIENLSGKKLSEINPQELKEFEAWLDRRITQINQQDKSFDYVVPSLFPQKYYRGLFNYGSEMQTLKKGDIFTDHGYSWFTPKKSYAEDFSHTKDGIMIETVIPAGTKISRDINISSDFISGLNPFSSMNIVLPRNSRYKVIETGVKNNQNYLKLKFLGI